MTGRALLYYELHSRWNRLRSRLERLRQPRYLVGAVAGGFYFYWYFFKMLLRRPAGGAAPGWFAEHQALAEALAALVLFVVVLMMWVFPHQRAALAFTEAEVAFLFPAPVGRRTLIHFKLLKSQTSILLSALFFSLLRWRGGGSYVFWAAGWWGVLSIVNLHLLGSSFARTLLLERGISNERRRLFVLGGLGLTVAGVVLWVRQTFPPPPDILRAGDFSRVTHYAGLVLTAGPIPWLLAPFRWAVAPMFAGGAKEFWLSLGPVGGLIALHYGWVIRSDVAFEEASVAASQKLAERVAAARSGNWQAMNKPKNAKRAPFELRPVGWPALGIFWKNLISAGHFFTGRAWFFLIWIAVVLGACLRSFGRHSDSGMVPAFLAVMLAVISLVYGPQILRHDFRQDLRVADMLKLFPMPGWQVVLGEVLAPAAILAGAQWVLLLLALFLCPAQVGHTPLPFFLRTAIVLSAALILPCVDFIALLLPNAAALIFPAWVQLGKNAPRGFETMGQQLILMIGQILVLAISMLPAGAAGGAVGFLVWWLSGQLMAAAVLTGALAAAVVLAAEAAFGVHLLGKVFERFDWSEGTGE